MNKPCFLFLACVSLQGHAKLNYIFYRGIKIFEALNWERDLG
jgi:hypothetical protein